MKKVINEAVFSSPLDNTSVNSKFGPRWGRSHNGVDLAANAANVKSPLDGIVDVGEIRNDSCGGTIIITHPDGFKTGYCHMQKINVRQGQKVRKGDIIGVSGGGANDPGRGRSDGRHLHFTLRKDGKLVDPMQYIDKVNVSSSDISFSGATPSEDGDDKTNWDDFFNKGTSKILPKKSSGIEDPLLKAILSPLEKALNLQSEMKEVYSVISEDYSLQNGDYTSALEYTIKKGKRVISPEEGVVKQVGSQFCKNSVLVQHTIQSKKFYSLFCNVEKVDLDYGDNIRKGSEIGTASENCSVNLLDSSKEKVKFKNVTRLKDVEKEKGITGDKFKVKNDPLLDLALSPLEKALNFSNIKTSSEADTIEPYDWVKWVQKNTTSKNESVQRNITKIKKLL